MSCLLVSVIFLLFPAWPPTKRSWKVQRSRQPCLWFTLPQLKHWGGKEGHHFSEKWRVSTNCEVSDRERIPRREGDPRASFLAKYVWLGICGAVLALRGFCPTRLPVGRGISASFGLIFLGEVGMLGEAGIQMCLTAGQLLVSWAVSRRAGRLLPSTGRSVSGAKKLHCPQI